MPSNSFDIPRFTCKCRSCGILFVTKKDGKKHQYEMRKDRNRSRFPLCAK